ncbi:MAG: NifB/NifX family molybdenum-iron cluster-binding protein [Desulfitobacteriaceae bacterium]|nr:NifB/NifX family molybdenum-iron cluster-binding protein [Desulfitobacteriaceae bacterium]MDD4752611.1 NifB/NifX family molybdenum-iron cluster-binding protein [Desulfitobacteriaceae bacterium]
MKIGIAKDGDFVSQHFGHCEGFEVFQVEDNKICGRETVLNPGHRPGFLPPYLAEKGVNLVIAGGMGATAQELFQSRGISVIVGAQGKIEDVLDKYLKGELVSSGSICEEHMHQGHCHD